MTDFNFKKLGTIDIHTIKKKLDKLFIEDWHKYTYRQDSNGVHKKTFTLPVLYDEEYKNDKGKKSEFYDIFSEDINYINQIINDAYQKKGELIRFIFVNLPRKCLVDRHYDRAKPSFKNHPRIHIPVQTHKDVLFHIGDETINMEEGSIYEINNNLKLHGVENNSDIDRVHIITDWKQTSTSYAI